MPVLRNKRNKPTLNARKVSAKKPYTRPAVTEDEEDDVDCDELEDHDEDEEKLTRTIPIGGVHLVTTVVFNTFFKWIAERTAMDERRRSGQPAPWTDDKIMNEYRFCNAYRVLDKGSQFLIRNVIEKGSQEPVDVLYRILLYQTFVRPSTFEFLERECGPLVWNTFSRSKFSCLLNGIQGPGKQPVFTHAYQIFPTQFTMYKTNIDRSLEMLEGFMGRDLLGFLKTAKYLQDVYGFIRSFPGMGPFTAYQVINCLSYSDLIAFHPNDFAVAGPGATSGMSKMFGSSFVRARKADPSIELTVMRWIVDNAPEQFKRLGLIFKGLGPEGLPLTLADVEHSLCEVDKYCRAAHPSVKGLSDRKEIKHNFQPSSAPYDPLNVGPARLPIAWKNPKRKTPRITKKCLVIPEKEWFVERIDQHREGKKETEYFVKWEGFTENESTWEPESGLVEGAAETVQAYRKAKNLAPLTI